MGTSRSSSRLTRPEATQALSIKHRLATLLGEPHAEVKAKYADTHIAVYAVRP